MLRSIFIKAPIFLIIMSDLLNCFTLSFLTSLPAVRCFSIKSTGILWLWILKNETEGQYKSTVAISIVKISTFINIAPDKRKIPVYQETFPIYNVFRIVGTPLAAHRFLRVLCYKTEYCFYRLTAFY